MLARFLYGGGLALVAAQMFAQGHVCGPGCSGDPSGYAGDPSYQALAPMPPEMSQAYRGQVAPNSTPYYTPYRRSMVQSHHQFHAQQTCAQQGRLYRPGMDDRRPVAQLNHGRGHDR